MTEAMFVLITVLVVLAVITFVLLVAMELHQAAATRATAERRLLESKLEIRRLRKEVRDAVGSPAARV